MEFCSHTAEVLVEALPYIKKFHGNTIVIKYGGHAMVDEDTQVNIISDIVLMRFVGMSPVIVHGGGPDINQWLKKDQVVSNFVDGLRVTDQATLNIAQMVLVGKVNQKIVSMIQELGANGIGFSGIDGGTLMAHKLAHKTQSGESVDLGFVGEIESVNPDLILTAIEKSYIPVISPIALGHDGNRYNINSDTVAAAVAAAIEADKFFLITDTDGILNENKERISRINIEQMQNLIDSGVISGGMIPKANCCADAISNGVHNAHIINGKTPHSLLLELFTDDGVGTMVTKE